jgi:hypothetical protein
MKKIIIACLLATSAASAFSEWTREGETNSANFYIDYETIRKDGSARKVWGVTDLKQRHKDGEMSRRAMYEYNCKNERFRLLALSKYSESMAGGETLFDGGADPKGWVEIPPNSPSKRILKIVCA